MEFFLFLVQLIIVLFGIAIATSIIGVLISIIVALVGYILEWLGFDNNLNNFN